MTAPYWPAMMLRKTAAAYCELSEAAFEREVASGLPRKIDARKANGLADGWKTQIGPKRGRNLIPALTDTIIGG